MTDNQLLQQLQSQYPASIELLMQKYHRYVYTVVANVLGARGTHEDIEELVQDTFYAVWSHAGAIRGNLKAYLSTSARNKAKSWLQRQRELPMALDTVEIPDAIASLDAVAQHVELNRILMRAIDQMRPKDREIFLRFYFYMQTTEEIAARLNISANAVRVRLTRGRAVLKKTFDKEDWL